MAKKEIENNSQMIVEVVLRKEMPYSEVKKLIASPKMAGWKVGIYEPNFYADNSKTINNGENLNQN